MVTTGTLYTELQKRVVQQQLELLLRNNHFAHSKRFPSFLRFIIGEELEGRGDLLKERTLGVEVFGRSAGYDTTSDPIVRVTAAEIRKRIAQYYQEAGHAQEVRISLSPGSYVPQFQWSPAEFEAPPAPMPRLPEPATEPAPEPAPVEPATLPALAMPEMRARPGRSGVWLWGLAGAALVLGLCTGGWWLNRPRPSALDRFWEPLLHAEGPIAVCFPRQLAETLSLRSARDPGEGRRFQELSQAINVDDLDSLVSLTGLLTSRHRHFTLIGQDAATLTDLRNGPAILLGAFDNAWALRATHDLRYRFANDPEMKDFWIEDAQNPKVRWLIDRRQQLSTNNYRDFAIVARLLSPTTGQLTVVSAGVARGGTEAAGEFLTRPGDMEAIRDHAPPQWEGKNMEFVLSTDVIDGRSAPPKIEAVYFW